MTTIVLACVTTDADGVLVVVGPVFVVELVLDAVDVLEESVLSELELSFELELELEFEFELEPDTLPGLLFNPVRATDQELDPPQVSCPYPAHFVLQEESEVLLLTGGSSSPHQQSVPFVVAITALPWPEHCC